MQPETQVEVLLVEDSDDDAEMTLDALRHNLLGNDVVWVRDGQEALDYLFLQGAYSERGDGMPSLVLLDIKMPKVDGLEVLRQLRENPATEDIPIVLLTSSAEEADIYRAYKLHANSYIVKPVNFEHFVAAIREVGTYWLVLNRARPPVPAAVEELETLTP